MSLNARKFRKRFEASGLSREDLARSVERDGLRARAAIDHWLNGRHSPRCKREDVEKLAQALKCEPVELKEFVGELRFARIAPRKAQLVIDTIRGKGYVEAWALLQTSKKRAARFISKALECAAANAQDSNQGALERRSLRIVEARVTPGPTLKRFQPKDRGRSHPIMKRTCNIYLAVDAR